MREVTIRPKRYSVVCGAIFGLFVVAVAIGAWYLPIGGAWWHSVSILGVPGKYWQVFYRFIGLPFGVLTCIHYGNISISDSLMIVSPTGIGFTDREGKFFEWHDVHAAVSDGKRLTITGEQDKKKWRKVFPQWLLATPVYEVAAIIKQHKGRLTNADCIIGRK